MNEDESSCIEPFAHLSIQNDLIVKRYLHIYSKVRKWIDYKMWMQA